MALLVDNHALLLLFDLVYSGVQHMAMKGGEVKA